MVVVMRMMKAFVLVCYLWSCDHKFQTNDDDDEGEEDEEDGDDDDHDDDDDDDSDDDDDEDEDEDEDEPLAKWFEWFYPHVMVIPSFDL